MCKVYLIHLDTPLAHASHYLGYTSLESAEDRLKRHKSGSGARLLAAANKQDITYSIVRTWECKDWREARSLERQLKKQKNSSKLCPVCRGGKPDCKKSSSNANL